jgi:hypothetical protein
MTDLTQQDSASDLELDHAWDTRESALYRAELSALYHQKPERFFELFDKLGKAIAIFGGSAALWKITNSDLVAYLAALITASSALSLVFSFSERSKRHAELARSFREISGEILGTSDFSIRDAKASEWMGKVCALEAKEPPALSALVVMCQNELAMVHKAEVHPQSFFVLCFAHFFDLPRTA